MRTNSSNKSSLNTTFSCCPGVIVTAVVDVPVAEDVRGRINVVLGAKEEVGGMGWGELVFPAAAGGIAGAGPTAPPLAASALTFRRKLWDRAQDKLPRGNELERLVLVGSV